jgi:hypothetical protein
MRFLSVAIILLAACGSHEASSPTAEPAGTNAASAKPPALPTGPVKPPDPSLPVSKRIQGKWRMDIARVPDTALTPEFLKLKRSGKAGTLLVQYTITDTDFTMEAYGTKAIWHNRFDYEILKEEDNALLLKKTDETGKTSDIAVVLKPDDELIIGTGNGQVPLQRIALPEHAR